MIIRFAGLLLAASLVSLSATAQTAVPIRPQRGWVKPAPLQPPAPLTQKPALAGVVTFTAAPGGHPAGIRQFRGLVRPSSRFGSHYMKLMDGAVNASGPWTVSPAAPLYGDILRMQVQADDGALTLVEFTDPGDPGLVFQSDAKSAPVKIQLFIKATAGKTYIIDAGLSAMQWSGTGSCTVLLAGPGGQQQTVPCPPAFDSHVAFAYIASASGYAKFDLSISPLATGLFTSFTVSQLN